MSKISPEIPVVAERVEPDASCTLSIEELMIKMVEKEIPVIEPKPTYALPDTAYIEATVLPLLLRGMEEVARTKPADPIHFLATYLFINNPQRREHIPTSIACDHTCTVNSSTYLEKLIDKFAREFHPCGSSINNNGVIDPEWLAAQDSTTHVTKN